MQVIEKCQFYHDFERPLPSPTLPPPVIVAAPRPRPIMQPTERPNPYPPASEKSDGVKKHQHFHYHIKLNEEEDRGEEVYKPMGDMTTEATNELSGVELLSYLKKHNLLHLLTDEGVEKDESQEKNSEEIDDEDDQLVKLLSKLVETQQVQSVAPFQLTPHMTTQRPLSSAPVVPSHFSHPSVNSSTQVTCSSQVRMLLG